MSRYDTVVIGAGLAGLTTACHLARSGQKVMLVAHGIGALLLATGCVDVLGFQPADSTSPVRNPLDKLDDFMKERPDHPYKYLGRDKIKQAVESFHSLINNGMITYHGEPNKNWLLPSGAGAIHPTCLAPTSLANGDLSKGGKVLVVGFRELRDFYPAFISQNINAQNLDVISEAAVIPAPHPVTDKMNITPIELSRAFEQDDFRQRVINAVQTRAKGFDRIGFPAVLGIKEHKKVLSDMEQQLGKPVFEISTLPPSVPGRRMYEALTAAFLDAKGTLIIGSKVVDGAIENGEVTQIRFETTSRLRTIKAKNYVLATGGIFGGGIQTDADGGIGEVWEPIFGLPIDADSNRHNWFSKGFLDPKGQPVSQYGITVNDKLNPMNDSGPVAKNLYIAGSLVAHSDWTRGRTGDGVAISTAAAIAEQLGG